MESITFILLRGLGRQAEHWGDFPSLLEGQLNDNYSVRVINSDLPGVGKSLDLESTWSLSKNIQILEESLKHCFQNNEKVILVGLSFGAMCALQWLSLSPDKIHSVILLNSSAADLSPWYKRIRPYALHKTILSRLLRFNLKRSEKELMKVLVTSSEAVDENIDEYHKIALKKEIPIQSSFKQLIMAMTYKIEQSLDNSEHAKLILNSTQDRFVDSSCSERIHHKLKNSRLLVNHESGHDLCLEQPDWVISKIRNHLDNGFLL